MAFFDGVLAEGPNHPIFNTLILGYMKGVEVVHIWAKFYVCLIYSPRVFKFQMVSKK